MFIRSIIVVAVPLAILAGCVVGPDYEKPDTFLSPRWQTKTDGGRPVLVDWWKALNDPVLGNIIAISIRDSLDIAAAKARVRQARASVASARGGLTPQIDYGASYIRSGTEGGEPQTQASGGFSTKWELDLFGGNHRARQVVYRELQGTNEELRAVLVTLISDVAANYVELRGIEATLAIAQENALLQQRTVALTRTRLDAGYISGVDLLSAETQAATTESQIPRLRISYSRVMSSLSILSGQSAFTLTQMLSSKSPVPKSPSFAPNGVPADILHNRPDIRAAERAYAASAARIGQAEAALFPAVSLSGTISTAGNRMGDLARLSSVGWSLGPSLTLPIFDGGRLKADVAFAEASRDISFYAYQKAVIVALAEVETASVSLNQNRTRVRQQGQIVRNSKEINRLTLDQFQTGRRSFIDVLNSQRDLLNAETSMAQANVDLAVSYIDLQRALGGSWSGSLDIETLPVKDTNRSPRAMTRKDLDPETSP